MEIEVKPVTRIEGHLDIYVKIGDEDIDVQIKAGGFRGFEKILIGRPIEETPLIVSRVCGVCPIAHYLASIKAVETILGIKCPEASNTLREILELGGVIQSHLLHLGFLLFPDIANQNEETSNIYNTSLFKTLIKIRSKAIRIVEISGGRHIHPFNIVPGGVLRFPSRDDLDVIEIEAKEALKYLSGLYTKLSENIKRFIENNSNGIVYEKTAVAALSSSTNGIAFYDGMIKVLDNNNSELLFQPDDYIKFIAEEPVRYSYAKKPYIVINGIKKPFRVGSLPRLLLSSDIPYDISKDLYRDFKSINREWSLNPLLYNLARLIETIYCFEKIADLVDKIRRLPSTPRTKVGLREGEGVGIVEAPRGLLIHHLKCDRNGIVTYANLIIPTAINIPIMEYDIKKIVRYFIDKHYTKEDIEYNEVKKRILSLVRSYDPCVSCATHNIHVIKH
jgi:F420-non-reducing hydrogenase large subunit